MISRRVFWGLFLCLVGIACAIAYVARERSGELAKVQRETRDAAARADADRLKSEQDKALAQTRATDAEARAKKAEAELEATRKHLTEWKTAAVRSGIIRWLGDHANCVARGSDGHCTAYRLPDGATLETDVPEQGRQAAR